MPEMPTRPPSKKQALRYLLEWSITVSDEIRDLRAEVTAENEEDVLTAQHDVAQDARIAELEGLLSGSEAERQAASQALDDTLAAVREQVTELQKDNPAPTEEV